MTKLLPAPPRAPLLRPVVNHVTMPSNQAHTYPKNKKILMIISPYLSPSTLCLIPPIFFQPLHPPASPTSSSAPPTHCGEPRPCCPPARPHRDHQNEGNLCQNSSGVPMFRNGEAGASQLHIPSAVNLSLRPPLFHQKEGYAELRHRRPPTRPHRNHRNGGTSAQICLDVPSTRIREENGCCTLWPLANVV